MKTYAAADKNGRNVIRRTSFAIMLCAMLLALCASSDAQQSKKVWRIGVMHVGLDHVPPSLAPLREELKKLGYEEGKSLHLDWRNLPDENAARAIAQEFVRDGVDMIVAYENQTVRAAIAATSAIPIVFIAVTDPVAEGFVKNFARPGGNITGFATWGELHSKELELFKEIIARLRRLLVLVDTQDPGSERALAEIRNAAVVLKVTPVEREVRNEADAERLFHSLKRGEADGVFIASPNLRNRIPSVIVRLSVEKRLPLAMHRKEWVEKGALFSYGYTPTQYAPAGAAYIDKIFKGTKAGDLPVQQPPQIEFVINLRVAKQIGVTIPPNVLARADKVIK